MGTAKEQLTEMYRQQIEALQKENKRLNKELRKVKNRALKIQLSNPDFDKALSEIEVDFELVKIN